MSEVCNVRVLGGGREVGRAAIALGCRGRYLLLDYGVNFSENDIPQFPQHIRPSLVDGVVITHAHLDHVGAAPLIYLSAKVPAVATRVTKSLIRIMIEDFLKISGYYIPYEVEELNTMLDNVVELDYGGSFKVGDFNVTLLNAGHIPGSAMALIEVNGFKVLYTGDVNTVETKLVKPATFSDVHADVLITEATYGSTVHPPREFVERALINAIRDVVDGGGNVLIPVFGLGRSQEILTVLYEHTPELTVYYDGMVRHISEVIASYPEYINKYGSLINALKEFNMVKSSSERRRVLKERGVVIVASAGMLKGGPAYYYAKHLSDSGKNAIYLVSYQARGTPGRRLLEQGLLEEGGQRVKARIQWFDFSSHADVNGLTEIVRNVSGLRSVIVVHTENTVGQEYVAKVKGVRDDVEVYYPHNGDEITISA